jgi:N-acetyltransferase
MKTPEDFQKMVEKTLAEQERGESVAFTTTEKNSGKVIGSTRFMSIDRANRRVEIGSTWIAPRCDALNQKSRNAILRLGATEEGTLRKHLITWTGRVRDTVYFSVLDSEWPEVKKRLESRLGRG